ncbi:MAG TPA: serine/threonine-protein kinase [Bryobacteraceae bacterium]|nr:serine/threonine-protein kinase [Bryobacteraceae bacterium]
MIGEIVEGKYRINRQLGAGGMGNVYLATHLGTTRVVAVKVIAPKWAADPAFVARFQREAQACGRLRHPNIVNVTDFGIAKTSIGDMPYLVMEYLDGQTLSAFQQTNPRPPMPLVADLLDQIGLALGEAHRQGIVHRDLKPDNIWLEPNGRGGYTAKVLDFGVAKVNLLGNPAPATQAKVSMAAAAITRGNTTPSEGDTVGIGMIADHRSDDIPNREELSETVAMEPGLLPASSVASTSDSTGQTMPGSLIGTPAYMSPEQALGKETDFRSDIYSLAVVAYVLVCGELPFAAKSGALRAFKASAHPPAPATARKVPGDVWDAVLAGLARNPADRPFSATAFARRFRNAVDAEFLAMRRSRAFLLQHLPAYALVVSLLYGTLLTLLSLLTSVGEHLMSLSALRVVFVQIVAAVLLVFFDNAMRAAAALVALNEQSGVRRFLSFRVLWQLRSQIPTLVRTQAVAMLSFGRGWLTSDCLWPVVCMVEKMSGKAAVLRSRELMTGLRSAGRALAIRHVALAAFLIADLLKSLGLLWRTGRGAQTDVFIAAVWFPVFAVFAAAPLFLYDRTAAREAGPLLQLDRTPEMRITGRPLSLSSTAWLLVGVIYLLYQPISTWLFGGS